MRTAFPVVSVLVCLALSACSGGSNGEPGGQAVSPEASLETSATPAVTVTSSPSPSTVAPSLGPTGPESGELEALALISIASVNFLTGDVVVGGYVSGVVESGGRCVYDIVNSAAQKVVTVETIGTANADSTSCGSEDIPAGKFATGQYLVTLTYSNAVGSASSVPTVLEVP